MFIAFSLNFLDIIISSGIFRILNEIYRFPNVHANREEDREIEEFHMLIMYTGVAVNRGPGARFITP